MSASVPEPALPQSGNGCPRLFARPWVALKRWTGASLANRLTLAVLLGATVMLAVVGGSSYLVMRRLLERSIAADLSNQLQTLQGKLADQLNQFSKGMEDTANSSFVTNGLTDSSGRDIYLVPFLDDHEDHGTVPLSLTLVDFQGHPVATGRGGEVEAGLPTAAVVAALASGRAQAEVRTVDGRILLEVVQPVIFAPTQSVEGALVGRLQLDQLFHSVGGVLPPKVFHLLRSEGRTLVASDRQPAPDALFSLQHPLELTAPLDHLGLVLQLGEKRQAIFAPLRLVATLYLASAVLLLALTYFGASALGRRLAAPITALSREAAAISAGGELQTAIALRGRDEIATLARAFAGMVAKLALARENLEGKIRERTEELHSSKVLLDTIVENIPHAIGVRDLRPGGRMVLWNRAAEETFGTGRDAVFAGEAPPLESLVVSKQGGRAFPPPGGGWDATLPFRHPREGRRLFLQTRTMTLPDAAGRPGHLLMIADDITSRRQVEEAIRLERLRFEVLYQMSQMVSHSEEAIRNYALEEAVRITGSAIGYLSFLDETQGLLSLQASSGTATANCRIDDPSRTFRLEETGLWGEAVRQRRPIITNDYAAPNPWKKGLPDGHVALTRHMNVPLVDNGRIVLVVGVGNKASEYDEGDVRHLTLLIDGMWRVLQRKRTEQSLRRSETSYRHLSQEFLALLEGIPDRITLLDPQLQVVWSNQEGEGHDLRHRRQAGVKRKFCYQLWDEAAEICAECPPARSFVSARSEQGQVETADGRTWDVRAIPIRNEQGDVVNVIELAQDISDRILAQEQTIRAAHLASLGELAAGVAHEINNPVNGIINYAQLLADRLENAGREADLAARIMREGERISVIVRNLLSFARPGRGERQFLYVAAALEDSLALTAAQLRREQIVFRVEIEPGLPMLYADSGQLRQVFLNILNNARYALNDRFPQGHPEKLLEIKAGRLGSDPERIRITFVDYGCGIPAKDLDRVMNPFFTTKPLGKGTGLGLSISHGIIAEHGGSLKLESVAGQFTRVRIDLPVLPDKEVADG